MNNAEPKQFDLFQAHDPVELFERLIAGLECGEWRLAREILQEQGARVTESNKRALRAAAEASEGQVISGQQGYKLTRHASREEIDHFTNQFRAQAAKMCQRVMEAEQVFQSTRERQPEGDSES